MLHCKTLRIKPGIFYPRIHPAGLLYLVGPGPTKFPIMDHIGLDSEDFTTSGGLMSTGLDRSRTDKNQKNSEELRPSMSIDRTPIIGVPWTKAWSDSTNAY